MQRRIPVATIVVRHFHPMKNDGYPKLGTKKNVLKRFRLTPNGRIKYWPSQLSGKARFVMPTGNFKVARVACFLFLFLSSYQPM